MTGKPKPPRGRLSPLILAIFGLLLTAHPLVADAAKKPENVLRRLFTAYYSGDARELRSIWSTRNDSLDTLLSDATILSTARCSDIEGFKIVEQVQEGNHAEFVAEVAVRQTIIRTGRILPLVIARWRVTMQQRATAWRIRNVEPWASFFVAKLASSTPEERRRLVRDQATWIDDSVVDALVRKARERELETDYENARDLTRSAYAAALDLGSPSAEARALAQQARLTYDAGDSALAIREAIRSCELAELAGDPDAQVFTDTDLGRLYLAVGSYSLALPIVMRALALKDQTIEMLMISRTYGQLFEIHYFDADVAAAMKTLREFERTARLARDPWGVFNVQFSLSALYFTSGELNLAVRAARKGIAIARSKHASQLVAAGLAEEALILDRAKDYRAALAVLDEARRLAVSTGNRAEERRSEIVAANIRLKMEPPPSDKEIARFRDTARSESGHFGGTLESIAALRIRQKRYAEALETLREVARWYDDRDAPASMKADVLALEAAMRRLRGERGEALALLRSSIAARESSPPVGSERERRLAFRKAAISYQQLAVMLIEQQKPLDAFLAVEHGRSRTLLSLLDHAQGPFPPDLTAGERASVTRLEDRIGELNRQLAKRAERDSALQKLDEVRADLEALRMRLFIEHPSPDAQPFASIAAADLATLPADVAFVEYVEAFDDVYALVLRNGKHGTELTSTKLPAHQGPLAAVTAKLGAQLAQRSVASAATSRRAFSILIAPIEKRLHGASALCIVPTGALWNVPFAALKDSRGHALAEKYSTFYDPAVTVFLHLARRPRQVNPMTLLAVGNPAVGGETYRDLADAYHSMEFRPLPDAEREVTEIAAMYPKRAEMLTGADATEDAVRHRLGKFDILHFAGHGLFDDRDPMFSRLLLATSPRSADDGFLEAREVMGLAVKANLVVLSACDTARGQDDPGEGLIGLAWAFQAAGSRAVIASKWSADSGAAASLMIEFHRLLLQGKPAHDALRHAQLHLAKQQRYTHPFYWASFILMGAP